MTIDLGIDERPLARVVHVKRAPYDIYVGRAMPGLAGSPFGNPFRAGRDGTRDEVIAKYRAHLESRPDLLALIPGLRGKVLACWCAPKRCHADVLAELANAMPNDDRQR